MHVRVGAGCLFVAFKFVSVSASGQQQDKFFVTVLTVGILSVLLMLVFGWRQGRARAAVACLKADEGRES